MINDSLFIEISVTRKCNKRCKYCFESKDNANIKNRFDVDHLISLLQNKCKDIANGQYASMTISFWGGEPFLDTEFMLKVIENTSIYDFVGYHVYTNGTLCDNIESFITDSRIINIKDRVHFQVSYDGSPHNELMRGYDDTDVSKTFELLSKNDIPFDVKATLSMECVDKFEEMWDSFHELHQKYEFIRFAPTIDTTNTDWTKFNIFKQQIIGISKKEMKFYIENGYYLMTWFSMPSKRSCDVNNQIFIDYDGNTYTCHGCPHVNNVDMFKGKNINDISILDECINSGYATDERSLKCVYCDAKFCSVCHITKIKDNIKENWNKCIDTDENLCKYYKFVGLVGNLMDYNILTRK